MKSVFLCFFLLAFSESISICSDSQTPEEDNCYYFGGLKDAIIIGSGSAGLATALLLQKENVTSNPVVFEGKPSSTSIPSEVYSMGGCIDTFRIPNHGGYLGNALIGYHYLSYWEDDWVKEAFSETVGEVNEEDIHPFEQPQYVNIFPEWNEDGSDLVVPLATGYVYVEAEGRRNDGNFMCLRKDGKGHFADECDEGSFKIQTSAKHIFQTTERKLKDFMNYHKNPKRHSRPDLNDRRYVEEVTAIPSFCLSMIEIEPEYEAEVWNYFNYMLGIMYGEIEVDDTRYANEVINSLLTSQIHRNMMKVPVASAFMKISKTYFDVTMIGLTLYQYLSTGFWIAGGPEGLKENFVEQITENGGEFKIHSKVTEFVYDHTYNPFFFFPNPAKEYICPRVFTYSICLKRCLIEYDIGDLISDIFDLDDDFGLLTCLQECADNRYACRGKKRVKGVIVNDETYYESDIVVTTAGHYQNYNELTPESVRNEFGYDEAFATLKDGAKVFYVWSSHDGSPASYGLTNSEYIIYPHPHEDFGAIEEFLESQTEFDENYVTPWIYISNSLRDHEFTEENPNTTAFTLLTAVSKLVWEPYIESNTHQRPDEYYVLKNNYSNFFVNLLGKHLGVAVDPERVVSATPLTQRDYLGYGYHLSGMSSAQDSPKSEDAVPQWHMKDIDNIFVAGNEQLGPGVTVVINSARNTIKYIQERDDEAVF